MVNLAYWRYLNSRLARVDRKLEWRLKVCASDKLGDHPSGLSGCDGMSLTELKGQSV